MPQLAEVVDVLPKPCRGIGGRGELPTVRPVLPHPLVPDVQPSGVFVAPIGLGGEDMRQVYRPLYLPGCRCTMCRTSVLGLPARMRAARHRAAGRRARGTSSLRTSLSTTPAANSAGEYKHQGQHDEHQTHHKPSIGVGLGLAGVDVNDLVTHKALLPELRPYVERDRVDV